MLQQVQAQIGSDQSSITIPGVVGLFGTTAPASLSLCGDVYKLPPGTPHLPEFSELNSLGAIYATALAVPNLFIGGVYGEASTTPSFGINYRGTFWITQPGEYLFSLTSDDGANLYIDDRLIIDNDGIHSAKTIEGKADLTAGQHTIQVKYMQTMPTNLALSLRVKRPNQSKWQLFDTRSLAP